MTADHTPPATETDIVLDSSQIPPPGGTPRPGPQRETGTPASGPSTDLTPPFPHTPSPPTGGCPRPGPQDRWTRRVTVTASAPHRTQVGSPHLLPTPGMSPPTPRALQAPTCIRLYIFPFKVTFKWERAGICLTDTNVVHSRVPSRPVTSAHRTRRQHSAGAPSLSSGCVLLLIPTRWQTQACLHVYMFTHTRAIMSGCAGRASDPLPSPG